jgi:flagellar P-ring protein precursor FlgI
MAKAINTQFPEMAHTLDAGTVSVWVPQERLFDLVAFVGEIGHLEVVPDFPARVVINERTGTIVAGEQVKISTVAVAHSNLAILTVNDPFVSQPAPLSGGTTAVTPRPSLGVTEQTGHLRVVQGATTVAELARALNALGVTPRDMIAIFQAIKKAGALHADLIIM